MKVLKLIFLAPIGFFFVLIIRVLARFGFVIRFGEFFSNRLGHLAGNTECYLCEKSAGVQKGFDIWAHSGEPANKHLAKMISRVIKVDPTGFTRLISLCNSTITGWERHYASPTQMDRDIHNLFEKFPPHLSFTDKELEYGYNATKRLGIPRGAKWVYLIVRDEAKHPGLPYHSYRNADIENYVKASEWLADQGYYVVRMGKTVSKTMPSKHPRIIDFTNEKHDDFLAVYLGAFCHFCISTSTGPDAIPYIFRRPICYADFVPVEYLFSFLKDSIAIWKHHEKDGKRMTFKEIIESKAGLFMRAENFEQAGITLINNTPEEILELVKEMEERCSGYEILNVDDTMQQKFWAEFPKTVSEYNNQPLHGEARMRIGSEFLRGYQ